MKTIKLTHFSENLRLKKIKNNFSYMRISENRVQIVNWLGVVKMPMTGAKKLVSIRQY